MNLECKSLKRVYLIENWAVMNKPSQCTLTSDLQLPAYRAPLQDYTEIITFHLMECSVGMIQARSRWSKKKINNVYFLCSSLHQELSGYFSLEQFLWWRTYSLICTVPMIGLSIRISLHQSTMNITTLWLSGIHIMWSFRIQEDNTSLRICLNSILNNALARVFWRYLCRWDCWVHS